ncbi:hypothetical protein [Streptomyces viridochromogenes]|uniref:hypothetical protein n=1 Tax=Streptomyces viridochromogenes TaxID=1938 RepID=UPI0001B523DE|nr:hypothetical protein [Streptomyces viridochromogenes]
MATPALQFVGVVLALGCEQLVQWKLGAMGLVALFLLGVGVKARNSTCASLGAVILLLLMTKG